MLLNRSGPEAINLFSCSTQLSTKFILLINVKMPTIVGILAFISMVNITSKKLLCQYVIFYEQSKFRAQLSSQSTKSFLTLGPVVYGKSFLYCKPLNICGNNFWRILILAVSQINVL